MRRLPRAVWAILALALVLRLASIELLTDRLPVGRDEEIYLDIARKIADGEGFPERPFVGGPSAIFPPGYPYALGLVFAISGDSESVARALNAVLGTVSVGLLGFIAWALWRRRDVALAAMGIAAVYPPLLTLSAPMMSESWFIPLVLGAFAAALQHRQTGALRWAVVAGLLAGGAMLFKSAGLAVALVVALLVWPWRKGGRAGLAAPAAAAIAACLVVLPWTIRNAVEFGAFVPVSNELGVGMAGVYNDTAADDPDRVWLPPHGDPDLRGVFLDESVDEAAMSRELLDRALEYVGDHPSLPAEVAYENLLTTFALRTEAPNPPDAQLNGFGDAAVRTTTFKTLYRLNQFAFLLVLALAIATIARREAAGPALLLLLFAGLVVLGYVFMVSAMRFRLPADLILVILAAPTVAMLLAKARGTPPGEAANGG